jgi:hypothetical protein
MKALPRPHGVIAGEHHLVELAGVDSTNCVRHRFQPQDIRNGGAGESGPVGRRFGGGHVGQLGAVDRRQEPGVVAPAQQHLRYGRH